MNLSEPFIRRPVATSLLMAALAFERFQENLAVKGTGRNAIDGQINLFPYAHCELVLFYRYQMIGQQGQPAATLFMAQLHYYL